MKRGTGAKLITIIKVRISNSWQSRIIVLTFIKRNCVVIFVSKYSKRNPEEGSSKLRKICVGETKRKHDYHPLK
jgi:hypothetical protein